MSRPKAHALNEGPIDPPRTFGYGRASTDKQDQSPETQRAGIQKCGDLWELGDVTMFLDPATSGSIPLGDRKAGKQLLLALRPGDRVIITKMDRMFRSLRDAVNVLHEFEVKGIKLYVCDMMGSGPIDLTSPLGCLLVQILCAFAELERKYISQRTKEGLANRVKKGVKHTRFPGYGNKWEKVRQPDGKLARVAVPDPEEREAMATIARWRMDPTQPTWETIAKHLNTHGILTKEGKPWSPNRVRRLCRAEFQRQAEEVGAV